MKKYIPYIVIAVLLAALVLSLINRREVTVSKVTSDTVIVVKHDTIRDIRPVTVTEKSTDTLYFKVGGGKDSVVTLPITQKYYSTDNYQAWVSGYKPNLDSIYTFNKVVTKTITNTETKTVYPKTTDVFLDAGCNYINNKFAPFVGASLKLKNGILLGGNVGLYDKSVYYGFKLGLKLNKNE